MKRPPAILFDVGDTLLREVSFDVHAGMATLESLCSIDEAKCCELADAALAAIRAIPPGGTIEFPLARWVAEQLDKELSATPTIDEIELHIWKHAVVLAPMPGALDMLWTLAAQGIVMGAVSNATFSAHVILHELERHGFAGPLRFVISSADDGVRKPGAAIFRQALSLLDADPADVWFIGDSWENDIVGASLSGLWPVWLSSSGSPSDDSVRHLRVADWNEFAAVWAMLPP